MADSITPLTSEPRTTSSSNIATTSPMASIGATKSRPAPPTLTSADANTESDLELKDMLRPSTLAAPDIMKLAQLGDENGIRSLLESGKIQANYADAEGITPL